MIKRSIKTLLLVFVLSFTAKIYAQVIAPGQDIVGYGYDVFGKFADNESKKKYPIFKWGANEVKIINSSEYNIPKGIVLENIGKKEKTTVSGSSEREYAKSYGGSVGMEANGLMFGGSVSAAFSKTSGGASRSFYSTIRDANRIWRISVSELVDAKQYLDPDFKKNLETMPVDKLFSLYGTHYIASAYLGGRADYTTTTKISEKYSISDISTTVSASYGVVSANASTNKSEQQKSIMSNTKTKLTVTGGNAEYAGNIENFDAYKLWAGGIRTRPVLCDFEKGSLIPIWLLTSNQARQNELEKAFEEMCKINPLPAYVGNTSSASIIFSKLRGNVGFDCEGGKKDVAGTLIQTWDINLGNDAQQFYIESDESGLVTIRTKGDLLLAVQGEAIVGAKIALVAKDKIATAKWKKESAGGGSVWFVQPETGLVIGVPGNRVARNLHLELQAKTKAHGQQFNIIAKNDVFAFGKNVFHDKWSSGWTTTKTLVIKNSPYLFHYKSSTGSIRNAAIINNKGVNNVSEDKWSSGWSDFITYKHGGTTHLMSIKKSDGLVKVNTFGADGQLHRKIWNADWSSGWSHIELVKSGKGNYFFHYKKGSGIARIGKLSPSPAGNVWEATWVKDVNSVKYFSVNKKDYVFVLSNSGTAWVFEITKVGDKLQLTNIWSVNNWEGGITKSVIVDYKTGPVVFMYKKQSGQWWAIPIHANGKLGAIWKTGTWGSDWDDFDSYNNKGASYLLHHKHTGDTRIMHVK